MEIAPPHSITSSAVASKVLERETK
jgi:hypothetical protein